MHIHVKQGFIQHEPAEAVVVNLFEGVIQPGGATGAVDRATDGLISDLIAGGDFKGKLNEVAVLYPRGGDATSRGARAGVDQIQQREVAPGVAARRIILVGLGKADEFNLDKARQAAGTAAKKANELGLTSLVTIVHGAGAAGLAPASAAQATVEGSLLALYRFDRLKQPKDDADRLRVESITVLEADAGRLPAVEAGARAGQITAEATMLARDLQNWPGNYATPTFLADTARRVAEETGMQCTVLEREDMKELGMGALLGVAQGSQEPPKFIVLEHNAGRDDPSGLSPSEPALNGVKGRSLPTVVLVGKGITFDSGGINIKPGEKMEEMKFDMSGGAAVIGAMQAVGRLDLPLRVIGLVPATENLPGGTAYKPGDVVRAMNGKTIEIISTDAEGRMILADALCYAQQYKPAAVVDLATLTGGCVVALGQHISGLFTNNPDLAAKVKVAAEVAEVAGEPVWELPLTEPYRRQIDSDTADMKNTGGRWGSPITAAALLQEFVDYPWVHLDIAGTAHSDKDRPYIPKGGVGWGVRTLVELLRNW
jgi:leucyl aminopeptidase